MATDTGSTWKDDLKKPVNIIGILLGVFGLVGTIYGIVAYYDARKVQEMSFIRHAVRIIDNSTAAQTIKILDSNNVLIKENVYVAIYTMWNSGNVNIEPGKVRRSIRYVLSGEGRILDSSIVKQNRDGIGEFLLTPDASSRNLSLSWKYLDKGMGFTTKIIYTGNDRTELNIDPGYVDDLRPLLNVGDSLEVTRFFIQINFFATLVILVPMAWIILRRVWEIRSEKWWAPGEWARKFRESPIAFVNLILLLVMASTIVAMLFIMNRRDFVPLPAIARELDFSASGHR